MPETGNVKRFVAYVAVGAAGTAAQYAVLFAGTAAGLATPATASAVGAGLGAAVNYWLNHRVTFRGARDHARSIPKFVATALAGIVLTWFVMHAMTQELHATIVVAQLVATALSLATTYTVNSAWTFRQRAEIAEPDAPGNPVETPLR
jgi:putative flippase GtrA